jgi:tetratricopeptide (TPR) repeat protein
MYFREMIIKKLHFPICIFFILCLFTIQSCKKKSIDLNEPKKKSNYTKYITLAEKYLNQQKFDSAFYYYYKIKSTSNPSKDKNRIIYSLLKLAYIQQVQGDYYNSESNATEAISFFQRDTDSQYKVSVYNVLGINYKNLFDFDNSIYYYNQALHESKDKLQKTIIKNNIAVVYNDKHEYQTAINILLPLTQEKEVLNNSETYSRVLDNLGLSYFETGNSKSRSYLNQSLIIREKIADDFGVTTSYLNLSQYYKIPNPKLALHYSKLAYAKASKINNVDDRLKALGLLIQNSNGNESKKYSLLHIKISDSINKVRQKAKNQFAKIKYDSTKEKNENLKLKTQKIADAYQLEQQKNQILLLSFLAFIALTLVLLVYYFWKTKNKREKIKSVYETETRISKKLHDELANDVYQAIAFTETLDLQNPVKKETLLGNLDKIYALTRNISRENSRVDTNENYETNLKEMLDGFGNETITVIVQNNKDIDWTKIKVENKVALHRILQELMVNMKKHSQCRFVVIGFENHKDSLQINYSDDGIGFENQSNLKNGLQNAENRIHAIKGTITFESEPQKGFRAKISFPK